MAAILSKTILNVGTTAVLSCIVIGLGQLKSSVLYVKEWLQDTLTALSQTTSFASLISKLAPNWQHRLG